MQNQEATHNCARDPLDHARPIEFNGPYQTSGTCHGWFALTYQRTSQHVVNKNPGTQHLRHLFPQLHSKAMANQLSFKQIQIKEHSLQLPRWETFWCQELVATVWTQELPFGLGKKHLENHTLKYQWCEETHETTYMFCQFAAGIFGYMMLCGYGKSFKGTPGECIGSKFAAIGQLTTFHSM